MNPFHLRFNEIFAKFGLQVPEDRISQGIIKDTFYSPSENKVYFNEMDNDQEIINPLSSYILANHSPNTIVNSSSHSAFGIMMQGLICSQTNVDLSNFPQDVNDLIKSYIQTYSEFGIEAFFNSIGINLFAKNYVDLVFKFTKRDPKDIEFIAINYTNSMNKKAIMISNTNQANLSFYPGLTVGEVSKKDFYNSIDSLNPYLLYIFENSTPIFDIGHYGELSEYYSKLRISDKLTSLEEHINNIEEAAKLKFKEFKRKYKNYIRVSDMPIKEKVELITSEKINCNFYSDEISQSLELLNFAHYGRSKLHRPKDSNQQDCPKEMQTLASILESCYINRKRDDKCIELLKQIE